MLNDDNTLKYMLFISLYLFTSIILILFDNTIMIHSIDLTSTLKADTADAWVFRVRVRVRVRELTLNIDT